MSSRYQPYTKERAERRLNGEDVFGKKITVAVSSADDKNWRARGEPVSPKPSRRRRNRQHRSGYQSQDSFFTSTMTQDGGKRNHPIDTSITGAGSTGNIWQFKPNGGLLDEAAGTDMFNFDSSDTASLNVSLHQKPSTPVSLTINNIDHSIRDIRAVLLELLREHGRVHLLTINNQADGGRNATVIVASQEDAHNIISKVHHQKLGYKRLAIEYTNSSNGHSTNELRENVISLLMEAPFNSMPLYRLMNLLEENYLMNVSVSEVSKLKDVCRITDEDGARIISLTADAKAMTQKAGLPKNSSLFCAVHCPNGMADMDDSMQLDELMDSDVVMDILHINMSLKEFALKLNQLLDSHLGVLPLLSFPVCYKFEFGEPLPVETTGNGVPLEHFVTCVNDVKLKYGPNNRNTKFIVREPGVIAKQQPNEAEKEALNKSISPSITASLNLLSRELVDLLKTTDKCQLLLSKYIPAYHHHFGRQLRVADYGYTKLSDLLHSAPISNIVQILGDGSKRVITLTHSAQIRRFTSDLIRVIKNQAQKQVTLDEFPAVYERVQNRPFNPIEYGLCSLTDLLSEVPDNVVIIKMEDDAFIVSIPKRDQTPAEVLRTKQFAEEVVKLLSYSPQFCMPFTKFVPAYHHHFGYQCKVSEYGFSKLIELFEAIPDTVRIEELPDGERKICLAVSKTLNLVGVQIADLIRKSQLSYLPLDSLLNAYKREYRQPLKPHYYECADVNELVYKLDQHITVNQTPAGAVLVPLEKSPQVTLALRVWVLLIEPPHYLKLETLISNYALKYKSSITAQELEQLNNVIINKQSNLNDSIIFLIPHYATAAKVYTLLYKAGGQMSYKQLEPSYRRTYRIPLFHENEDAYDLLFKQFTFLVTMRRIKREIFISLNPKLEEIGLPLPVNTEKPASPKVVDEIATWPPPPPPVLFENNNCFGVFGALSNEISPPKPDTPPPISFAPITAPWTFLESPRRQNMFDFDFSIPLPLSETPLFTLDSDYLSLISPAKNLLSPQENTTLPSMRMHLNAPQPEELPMPDKLLSTKGNDDTTDDSGVNNLSSQLPSETEMDFSLSIDANTHLVGAIKAPNTARVNGGAIPKALNFNNSSEQMLL